MGYFKESVVESRFENYKVRKLIVLYHLEDHSLMISEPRQVNSGTPQGVFLKRQMVLKQDGSGLPMLPTDFRVGIDVGILGRSIRIYDCDQYTREFFEVSARTNSWRYTYQINSILIHHIYLVSWTTSRRCPLCSNGQLR